MYSNIHCSGIGGEGWEMFLSGQSLGDILLEYNAFPSVLKYLYDIT